MSESKKHQPFYYFVRVWRAFLGVILAVAGVQGVGVHLNGISTLENLKGSYPEPQYTILLLISYAAVGVLFYLFIAAWRKLKDDSAPFKNITTIKDKILFFVALISLYIAASITTTSISDKWALESLTRSMLPILFAIIVTAIYIFANKVLRRVFLNQQRRNGNDPKINLQ